MYVVVLCKRLKIIILHTSPRHNRVMYVRFSVCPYIFLFAIKILFKSTAGIYSFASCSFRMQIPLSVADVTPKCHYLYNVPTTLNTNSLLQCREQFILVHLFNSAPNLFKFKVENHIMHRRRVCPEYGMDEWIIVCIRFLLFLQIKYKIFKFR